jgi:hypothetical protein
MPLKLRIYDLCYSKKHPDMLFLILDFPIINNTEHISGLMFNNETLEMESLFTVRFEDYKDDLILCEYIYSSKSIIKLVLKVVNDFS